MAGVQGKGPILGLKEMNGDLDQMIDMTHRQILIEKKQLRLTEERYANLINKKNGNTDHQTKFGKDVVNPWDSRKDFDADAEECIKAGFSLQPYRTETYRISLFPTIMDKFIGTIMMH